MRSATAGPMTSHPNPEEQMHKSRKRAWPRPKRLAVAVIKYAGTRCASIHRSAFEAIADQPMFDEVQGPAGASVLTVRQLIEQPPSCDQRIYFGAGLVDRLADKLRAFGRMVRVCDRP